MLTILFMLIFLFSFCFMKNMFWMFQNFLFIIMFILILLNYFSNYWVGITYFSGMDLLSYGKVLLSFWICTLMLMDSDSINKYNNYKNLFLLNVMVLFLLLVLTFMV